MSQLMECRQLEYSNMRRTYVEERQQLLDEVLAADETRSHHGGDTDAIIAAVPIINPLASRSRIESP